MANDNYAVLMNPDLHDGYLFGVIVDEEKTLKLLCKHVDGTIYTLMTSGVVHLRTRNFWEGNIIFEFRVYDAEQCPVELLTRAFTKSTSIKERPWSSEAEEIADLKEEVSRVLEGMKKDHCVMLELAPSYGCHLIAIARCGKEDIRFQPA